MKKISFLLLVLLIKALAFSQNPVIVPDNVPGAYIDYLYTSNEIIVSKDLIYKSQSPKLKFPIDANNPNKADLLLDVYYPPVGSNCISKRPLIVIAPGGGGVKENFVYEATELARRGYVVSVINHSVAENSYNLVDHKALTAITVFCGAMNVHQAIKYLTVDNASLYGIDPNTVITMGGSFGGATSIMSAYVSKSEVASITNYTTSDGITINYANIVNNSYFNDYNLSNVQQNIKGVIAFAPSILNTSWITQDENIPTFMFHGLEDGAVPYNSGNLFTVVASSPNTAESYVYGSASIATRLNNLTNKSFCLISAKNIGHTYTPTCGYRKEYLPTGYPMNYWPEMLAFVKNSMLCEMPNKIHKVVECIEPECKIVSNCKGLLNLGSSQIPINITTQLPIQTCQPTTINEHCHDFSFDGGDYIKVNNSANLLSPTSDYCVEFWFKKNISNPTNSFIPLITYKKDSDTKNSFTFGLIGNNNFLAASYSFFNDISYSSPNITSIDNGWHHYKIYFNNSSMSVKIDNIIIINNTAADNSQQGLNWYFGSNNSINSYLGITTSYTQISGINGQLDEIRIWKGIAAFNSNSTNGTNICPNQTDLLAYYKLNADGQTVLDQTNNHNDGTKGATVAIETSDPTYVTNCNTSARMSNPNPGVEPTKKTTIISEPIKIKEDKDVLDIFPNPSDSKPNILFLSSNNGICSFELMDLKGTILTSKQNIVLTKGVNILSNYLPNLASGIYLVKIYNEYNVFEQKFVITK